MDFFEYSLLEKDTEIVSDFVRKNVNSYYAEGKTLSIELFEAINKAFESHNTDDYTMINFSPIYFLKSESSMVRSIVRDMDVDLSFQFLSDKKKETVLKEALNYLKDFYRMNFCIKKDELFEDCSIDILQKLLRIKGIKLREYIDPNRFPYKDSFHHHKNGCKDFKAFLDFNGYPFEIQLHNTSSEDMNLATHGIYEDYRAPDLRPNYKKLRGDDRIKLYNLVKSPEFSEDRIVKEGLNYHGR